MKKKYLVSVPILCKAEVYVDAENELEAMELGMLAADKESINHETIEALYFNDTLEEMQTELLDFATNNGYIVWDCKEEFGE